MNVKFKYILFGLTLCLVISLLVSIWLFTKYSDSQQSLDAVTIDRQLADDKSDLLETQLSDLNARWTSFIDRLGNPSSLPVFANRQFNQIFENSRLDNVVVDNLQAPYIYNNQMDEQIRAKAIARGYRLQPIVDDIDKLVLIDGERLQLEAAMAWQNLKLEASTAGYNLILTSGYRDYDVQRNLFKYYVQQESGDFLNQQIANTLTLSAPPGYSKHHTGYTLDILSPGHNFSTFQASAEYEWLSADNYLNVKKHGFIPSYPPDVEKQGPEPEPWEYIYVGIDNIYRYELSLDSRLGE